MVVLVLAFNVHDQTILLYGSVQIFFNFTCVTLNYEICE